MDAPEVEPDEAPEPDDIPDHACGILDGVNPDNYAADDDLPEPLAPGEGLDLFVAAQEALAPPPEEGMGVLAHAGGLRALWLPAVAQAAGLRVAVQPHWETRGRDMTAIDGVIAHHTASSATAGNAPALYIVTYGRSDLSGPLSQVLLARDGLVIVVAAGRANHAGAGYWDGITDGNGRLLGIEAENDGRGEPWTARQYDAYVRLVAAILRHIRHGAGRCPGHKEYARPIGRKPDPTFDMARFRANVDHILRGTATAPPPVTVPKEFLMALTTEEQKEVLATVRDLKAKVADLHRIRPRFVLDVDTADGAVWSVMGAGAFKTWVRDGATLGALMGFYGITAVERWSHADLVDVPTLPGTPEPPFNPKT